MSASSFALIAHELKNALASLESELEAMIDDPTPIQAHSAHAHCATLRRQFVQFLTVYGSEGGLHAHAEDESPVDLLSALQRQSALRRLKGETTVDVVWQPPADAPPFWFFDRRLVQLALEAALHNAMRFARQRVVMGLREEDGMLVVSLDDDGPGLDAEDTNPASTGLGTRLCEAVASAHRHGAREGRVRLFDRPEGGARFELWLP